MSQTICFDVKPLENVFLRRAFFESHPHHLCSRLWPETPSLASLSGVNFVDFEFIFRPLIDLYFVHATVEFQHCISFPSNLGSSQKLRKVQFVRPILARDP